MTSPWIVVSHVAADGDNSALSVAGIASMLLFDLGALAVGHGEPTPHVQLTAGFGSEDEARHAADELDSALRSVSCEAKVDPDYLAWVDQQREGIQPTTVGGWRIRAPWYEPIDRSDPSSNEMSNEIVIDPGSAFGHGAHPSTRLSIELLLEALELDGARNLSLIHI